jgi:hypothetical protein
VNESIEWADIEGKVELRQRLRHPSRASVLNSEVGVAIPIRRCHPDCLLEFGDGFPRFVSFGVSLGLECRADDPLRNRML